MGYYKKMYGDAGFYRRPKREVNFEIIGDDKLREMIKKFDYSKQRSIIVKSFRTGSKPLLAKEKAMVPAKFSAARKAVMIKTMRGPAVKVGPYFNRVQVKLRGSKEAIDAYYPLYWANYGTLENRDDNHKFKRSRKRNSAHWRGGMRPLNFIEKAWEATKNQCQSIIDRELDKAIMDHMKKYAVA